MLRLSVAFALLIGASLGLKLLGMERAAEPDGARLARDVAAALAARGFRTALVPHHLFDYVAARNGPCSLVAANAQTEGYLQERFAEETIAIGRVSYHYGAGPGGAFPRVVPAVAEHLQNWAYPFGLVVSRTPVIAIAASPACRLESVDWGAFRIWPMPLRSLR